MSHTAERRELAVSVILCTCNRPKMLDDTLESILAGDAVPAELIVVDQSDQASEIDLATAAAEAGCHVCHVRTDVKGLSRANNWAAGAARHELLVFTHDDVRVEPDWLQTLLQALVAAGPRTVVTGRVLATAPEVPGGFAPALMTSRRPATYQGRLGRDVLKPLNMALYRPTLLEVGGFDEELGPGTAFPGAEDSDLGFRLLEAGHRIEYVPAAVVYHRAWRKASDYLPLRWGYGVAQGAFYAKHLRLHDRYMLTHFRSSLVRRARRFPRRVWHEGSRAFGDPLFILGNLVGAARWWSATHARAPGRSSPGAPMLLAGKEGFMKFLARILERGRRGRGARGEEVSNGGPAAGGRAPEIHLVVLWEKARPWSDRIVRDISSHFRIIDGVELRWTSSLAARHYTRLYGQSLPSESVKLRECGNGPPLLLVVSDDMPQYAERRQWGRTYTVNAKLFDAKQRYRRWAGGSGVHSTSDVGETEHDLFLLLGLRAADYTRHQPVWSGAFRPVQRDLTGTGGWRSREELFTAIGLTLGYVTLPPVDNGPEIRLLLEGWWPHWGVEWLIAEPKRHPESAETRVYPVVVGSERIRVKCYHVGDGHHDARWQKAMLQARVPGAGDEYVLAREDAYRELLHELVLRGHATASDAARLARLAEVAGQSVPDLSHPATAALELEAHLAQQGYGLSRQSAERVERLFGDRRAAGIAPLRVS